MKTDYKTIKVDLKDGVAVLAINNPPVNQMAPQMAQDFGEAFNWAFIKQFISSIWKEIIISGLFMIAMQERPKLSMICEK